MNRHFVAVAIGLLSCWLSVATVFAQSPPVADTYVAASQPDQNFGHAPSMAIGGQSNAYLRFNLGNIPPNSTVTKATLRLYVDGFLTPGQFDVYEIDQPWNEFLTTWNNAPPLGASATGNNPVHIALPNNTTFILVDITDLVQQWVNGTVTNNGIAIALTTSYGSFTLESKENTETSHEPELEVALAGAQGAQGPQGPPGPEGPAGPQGDQGPAGTNGLNGTNGQGFTFRNAFNNGTSYNPYDVVTYSGSTYEASVAIPAGGGTPDQNPNWSLWAQVGSQGQPGQQGAQGPAGPQGDQGPAGTNGLNGLNGTNGQGFTFRNAFSNGTSYNPYDVVTYSGSTYEASVAIPAGGGTPDQNANWSLWAQVGSQGQQGAQGPAGAQGPQGDQGPAGTNGLNGLNGTNGQGFTFRNAFNNGTSYNPYDVVTYSGSTYEAAIAIPAGGGTPDQNPNWSLWAQVGSQGQQGAQGPAGAQGLQGDQGPAGLNGTNGTNGTNGQGFTFRSAFDNGTSYNPYDVVTYSGSTYEAAVAIPAGGGTPDQNASWSLWAQVGSQGQQGAQGPAGAQGPQGDQGPAGTNGLNGLNGTNGQGFTFRNVFNNGTSYNPYDVVTYSGSTYEASVAIPAGGGTPDQNANWSLWAQVGSQGQPGQQGAQGPAGAQGPQGDQGPAGTNGLNGLNGTNGQGFTFRNAFNNGTSYNPYDVVTYSGSTYEAAVAIPAGGGTPDQNASWSLWAQVGSQGQPGAQGPAGAQGLQGDQGPAGLNGTNGTNGTNGQGFTFRNAFSNGTSYNPYDVVTYSGSTYEASVAIPAGGGTPDQNANWSLWAQVGAQGQQGTQGASGPAGPQGPEGPQGQQGLPGNLNPGSPYYIQNGSSQQTSASFNIDGSGSVGTSYQIGGVPVLSLNTTNSTLTLGPSAGNSVTTFGTFLGMNAGMNETAGQNTVAVGYNSGPSLNGSDNTLVGTNSGYYLGTGGGPASSQNTVVGSGAGQQFFFGTGNVLLGYQAGWNSVGGNYNIYIGENSGDFAGEYSSNNIYISNSETGLDNNTIRIGTQGTGNGQQNQVFIAGIVGTTISNGSTVFVDTNGRLGVGTSGHSGVTSFNGRTGAVVPISNDYSFSQLSGSLGALQLTGSYTSPVVFTNGSDQFSGSFTGDGSGLTNVSASSLAAGTYGNQVVFSNSNNIFSGDGSGLTNVSASSLAAGTYGNQVVFSNSNNSFSGGFTGSFSGSGAGLTSVNAATLGGLAASGFIQNGTAQQASSNFNVSGNGTAGGTLTGTTAINTAGTYQIAGTPVLQTSTTGLFVGTTGTGGQYNVFAGQQVALGNTSGSNDVFVGLKSGQVNTTGSVNVFLGTLAGAANTTNGENTYLGMFTGQHNDGSYNTFIGYCGGCNVTTGNDDIYINNSGGTAAESNTIRIGVQGTGQGEQNATYIAGISGSTVSSGTAVFVDSTGKLGTLGGSNGFVTSFNGRGGAIVPAASDYSFSQLSGTLSASQVPAGSASYIQNGTATQTGTNFVIDGYGSASEFIANNLHISNNATILGTFTAGTLNTTLGYAIDSTLVLSLGNNPDNATVSVGPGTGQNGALSTYVGFAAGYKDTTSNTLDTFIGNYTGGSNSSGAGETFVGGATGANLTGGAGDTLIGALAGQVLTATVGETLLGYQTGGAMTSGGGDLLMGFEAGGGLLTSTGNTFVGAEAGVNMTGGTDNILIGIDAGQNLTGSQTIADIYIGTLGVAGESNTIRLGTTGTSGNYQKQTFIAGISGINVSGGTNVVVNSNGQLGIAGSSRRFKDNILDMGDASSKLFQLRPVTFFYKPQYDDGSHIVQYGLIAEEVAKIYPDLVVYDTDGQPQTVRYHLLTPMLLNELQKQHKIVSDQQDVITTQQQQIESLQQGNQSQKQEIELLQQHSQDVEQRLSRLEALIGKSSISQGPTSSSNLHQ